MSRCCAVIGAIVRKAISSSFSATTVAGSVPLTMLQKIHDVTEPSSAYVTPLIGAGGDDDDEEEKIEIIMRRWDIAWTGKLLVTAGTKHIDDAKKRL